MAPGTAVAALAVLVIVRPAVSTTTVAVQPALPLAGAQLLPVVAEVTVLVIVLSPVSGLFTVTE